MWYLRSETSNNEHSSFYIRETLIANAVGTVSS
jgi:hypothetical protein